MKIEFEDLWEWDMATRSLRPILDPLTIKVRIIRRDKGGDILNDIDIVMNKVINISSKLKRSIIMFFRHQHSLINLINIIVFIKIMLEFSTSKVDILLNY